MVLTEKNDWLRLGCVLVLISQRTLSDVQNIQPLFLEWVLNVKHMLFSEWQFNIVYTDWAKYLFQIRVRAYNLLVFLGLVIFFLHSFWNCFSTVFFNKQKPNRNNLQGWLICWVTYLEADFLQVIIIGYRKSSG